MILTQDYVEGISTNFPDISSIEPWIVTDKIRAIVTNHLRTLDSNYTIDNGIAIHHTAVVENNVVLKEPIIISENCFIASGSYLRDGVFLDKNVTIGPGCEIKSSMIFKNSTIAHFNFIGDSIIGSHVNMEAGAIIANHLNEKKDKKIRIKYQTQLIETNSEKFGALIGDFSKIGANAVLSPGSILAKNTIVKRLELIDQSY